MVRVVFDNTFPFVGKSYIGHAHRPHDGVSVDSLKTPHIIFYKAPGTAYSYQVRSSKTDLPSLFLLFVILVIIDQLSVTILTAE